MAYVGIDYGHGLTNRDTKTGIRYGVIPAHAVGEAWYESSEPDYGKPHCPECETELDDSLECKLHGEIQPEDAYPEEPFGFSYSQDGYEAYQGQDGDIFITKSPFVTRAAFCSPCAPGACYLLSPNESGERAYCFGPDWFENETAPYPVSKT